MRKVQTLLCSFALALAMMARTMVLSGRIRSSDSHGLAGYSSVPWPP